MKHGQAAASERAKAQPVWRLRCLCLLGAAILTFGCDACTYRLYAPLPPSEERLKILAKNPERYVLHIQERAFPEENSERSNATRTRVFHETNYEIPSNGLVTIRIPAYRPDCGVYLFNWIKLGGSGNDALKLWEVTVLSGVQPVRVLSLEQVRDLPSDAAGFRLLRASD
jgi:hypothetical protein